MRATTWLLIFCTLISFFGAMYFPPAESMQPVSTQNADTEAKVKAAFIFNFTRFITWKPKKDDAPLRIVIFGSEKISSSLKSYIEEKNLSSAITVISSDKTPAREEDFDLIFIDNSKERFCADILRRCSGKNILSVSDIEDFANQGGIIGMHTENGRIKLAINLNEANKSGLKISAKLLELAKVIK